MLNIQSNNFSKAMDVFSAKTPKDLSLIAPIINGFEASAFKYTQRIEWHGLQVILHLQSENFLNEINNYFPKEWLAAKDNNLPSVQIYIFDDQKHNIEDSYWLDPDPNCHLYKDSNTEWACQRDFLAKKNEQQIIAVCKNTISDGFFNLMRSVLPRFWLNNNQFLFHSSCVLNNQGEAFLCLGPSGAGKTTISKFLPREQVLGDDMNLITVCDDGKVLVTPSLLGQSYESSGLFGKSFPLKQIFWITKSERNKIITNDKLSLSLKVCMSLVNIFWEHLSPNDYLSVQGVITSLNKNYDIKELQFSLDKGVWGYVFNEI